MHLLKVILMNDEIKKEIQKEFKSCVDRTITRISKDKGCRPFHAALLSEEVLFWSKFERSFSTSFGQRVIEKISKLVVLNSGANNAETQRSSIFDIDINKLTFIDNHISSLRDGSRSQKNWAQDIIDLNNVELSGTTSSIRVISDLWWEKNGINNFMSIKTVKPNIDQTAEAKKDLLKLKAFDPNCNVYFGLYYNPFGEEKSLYNWTPPKGIFNFTEDACVLIGQEYWEILGGDGTYAQVLELAEEIGTKTKESLASLR